MNEPNVDAAYERLAVSIADQTLAAYRGGRVVRVYPVSTAKRGHGQTMGSEKTPLGPHIVRVKIGEGAPQGAVFVGRRPTGEIWSPELHDAAPGRDWILTRILWLSGRVRGLNRRGEVDTLRRFIYIHGSPDCEPLGAPASHGCIRMGNADVVELFDRVERGTPVDIERGDA